MNISAVAKKTGLTSKTIRFYEEKGLLSAPMRGENGYRRYGSKQLDELLLLRQARQAGFNLDECRELVALFNNPERHSADVKQRTLQKMVEIEQQIKELTEMHRHLAQLVEQCPGDDSAECPIINDLANCCHSRAAAREDAE